MAQPGRALGSGPRGRRFESSRPDQLKQKARITCGCRLRQPHFLSVANLWTKIFHVENLRTDDVRYMCKNQPKKLKAETRPLRMVPFFGGGTVWSVWIGQKISSLIRDDKSRYPSTPATLSWLPTHTELDQHFLTIPRPTPAGDSDAKVHCLRGETWTVLLWLAVAPWASFTLSVTT